MQRFVGVAAECLVVELGGVHAEVMQRSDFLWTTLPAHRSDSTNPAPSFKIEWLGVACDRWSSHGL